MTVEDIVRDYLERNGYDGLCDPGECSCGLGSLMHCDSPNQDCVAGHKVPCECSEDCGWHIAPGRRPKAGASNE